MPSFSRPVHFTNSCYHLALILSRLFFAIKSALFQQTIAFYKLLWSLLCLAGYMKIIFHGLFLQPWATFFDNTIHFTGHFCSIADVKMLFKVLLIFHVFTELLLYLKWWHKKAKKSPRLLAIVTKNVLLNYSCCDPTTINSKLSKFQNCTFKTWCYTLIQLPINNSQVHASCFTSNTLSEHLVSKNPKFRWLFFIKKLIGSLLVFLFLNKVSSILWKSPWLWFKAKKLEYKQIH